MARPSGAKAHSAAKSRGRHRDTRCALLNLVLLTVCCVYTPGVHTRALLHRQTQVLQSIQFELCLYSCNPDPYKNVMNYSTAAAHDGREKLLNLVEILLCSRSRSMTTILNLVEILDP
jgi:hypothetical protein